MSKYQIHECDRCHKQAKNEDIPSKWAEIRIVLDTNLPANNNREFMFCQRCMGDVMDCIDGFQKLPMAYIERSPAEER